MIAVITKMASRAAHALASKRRAECFRDGSRGFKSEKAGAIVEDQSAAGVQRVENSAIMSLVKVISAGEMSLRRLKITTYCEFSIANLNISLRIYDSALLELMILRELRKNSDLGKKSWQVWLELPKTGQRNTQFFLETIGF